MSDHPREQGSSVLLVAAALLLMMGMAALAIDAGAGWNERRQDQTSSDLAAIAGGLSYGDSQEIVAQVIDISQQNIDTQYTDADWYNAWVACSDPDRPAGFTPLVSSSGDTVDCISLNVNFLRVRLPEQTVETTFGRVLGLNSFSVDADSVVTLFPDGNGLLPFAVLGGTTPGEICLETGTGSKISDPCTGNESGSFGNIAPPLFGNPILGTQPDCNSQSSANNYVAESIAMGIDHIIWRFPQSSWNATGWSRSDGTSNGAVDSVANMDECTDTGGDVAAAADGLPIEAVYVDTGNNVKADSTEGLITGTGFADGKDARLTRTTNGRSLDGYTVDNTPLWAHLLPYTTGPATQGVNHTVSDCDPSAFTGQSLNDKNLLMRTCLENYGSSSEQIFDDTILDSPRFGVAPLLWHDNLGSGISYRPLEGFGLVYLAGVWLDDKSGTVFYPDDADSSAINPSKKKWEIEQVTSYYLEPSMVSELVQQWYPGFDEDSLTPTLWE